MFFLDPVMMVEQVEAACGGTPSTGAIFVSKPVLDFMVKVTVIPDERVLAPAPATLFLGLPVYLDPTAPFGGFQVITDTEACASQLFLITHAIARGEVADGAAWRRN